MTRQRARTLTRLTILLSSAVLLPFAACVTKAAQTVNVGIATVGSVGVRGAGQAFDAVGDGVSLVAHWLTQLGS